MSKHEQNQGKLQLHVGDRGSPTALGRSGAAAQFTVPTASSGAGPICPADMCKGQHCNHDIPMIHKHHTCCEAHAVQLEAFRLLAVAPFVLEGGIVRQHLILRQ